MESVYLKTLVEVVKAGSLSRAAEVLCVTQPAVSRRIKFLEDQYGCALLDRSGSQIRPTEAGRMVYQKAGALLEIEAELEAGLQQLEGKTRLSFSCTPAFGSAHMPAVLRDFMLTCVDTADLKFLFLSPSETLRGLGEGVFDAGVVEGATLFDPASFSVHPLPEAETVFMTSPEFALPSRGTLIDSLLELPLYTRREGCCSRMLMERGLKGIGLSLSSFRKVIILDDLHLLIQAVLAGEGISFLPTDLVQEHIAAGRINLHRIPGFDHSRSRTLVVNDRLGSEEALGHFVNVILAHFGLPPSKAPAALPPKPDQAPVSRTPMISPGAGCLPPLCACPGLESDATQDAAGFPEQLPRKVRGRG